MAPDSRPARHHADRGARPAVRSELARGGHAAAVGGARAWYRTASVAARVPDSRSGLAPGERDCEHLAVFVSRPLEASSGPERKKRDKEMATYEDVCDACEHQFDELQSFSDKPLTKCPKCKKKKLRRLFGTGASIIFKGSGFYETDYRSESYKAGAKKEEEAAKPKSDGDSAKGTNGTAKYEAKPAPSNGKVAGKGKAAKSGKVD